MRNLLIQALRKWGSDSVVVTWTWIAEESLEADSIWPARSLHTCFTHADQTDPVCAELTGSKTKTLLVGNSFNGLASLNLLFDHCGLKTLNTPGALSVLSVMEKYMIFLFFLLMWRKAQANFPGWNLPEVWRPPQNRAINNISQYNI